MSVPIRILGIDPGLRLTGWGIIEQTGMRLTHVAHGVITAATDTSMAERLAEIFEAVGELARRRDSPAQFLEQLGVPVCEFAPRQIKLSVVGTGTADKDQVKFMVQRLLPRAGEMKLDAADALACAICTAHHLPAELRTKGAA